MSCVSPRGVPSDMASRSKGQGKILTSLLKLPNVSNLVTISSSTVHQVRRESELQVGLAESMPNALPPTKLRFKYLDVISERPL